MGKQERPHRALEAQNPLFSHGAKKSKSHFSGVIDHGESIWVRENPIRQPIFGQKPVSIWNKTHENLGLAANFALFVCYCSDCALFRLASKSYAGFGVFWRVLKKFGFGSKFSISIGIAFLQTVVIFYYFCIFWIVL